MTWRHREGTGSFSTLHQSVWRASPRGTIPQLGDSGSERRALLDPVGIGRSHAPEYDPPSLDPPRLRQEPAEGLGVGTVLLLEDPRAGAPCLPRGPRQAPDGAVAGPGTAGRIPGRGSVRCRRGREGRASLNQNPPTGGLSLEVRRATLIDARWKSSRSPHGDAKSPLGGLQSCRDATRRPPSRGAQA